MRPLSKRPGPVKEMPGPLKILSASERCSRVPALLESLQCREWREPGNMHSTEKKDFGNGPAIDKTN